MSTLWATWLRRGCSIKFLLQQYKMKKVCLLLFSSKNHHYLQCGGKDNPEKQLLCDECDLAYHIYCLDPPLETIPDDDEWYCSLCKNDASEVWYDYFCLLAYSSCLTVLCFLVDQNKIKYFLGKEVWQQPITAGPAEGEGLWGNHPPHPPPPTHTHTFWKIIKSYREKVFSASPCPFPPTLSL